MKLENATKVIVRVSLLSKDQLGAFREVEIELPENRSISLPKLIDACQRSVAHCIDELSK